MGQHTATDSPHHQCSSRFTKACAITTAAWARKVAMVPTDSQINKSFLAGLKSRVLRSWEVFLELDGSGFPPGPVWSRGSLRVVSTEAVAILWAVKAARKKTIKMMGEAKWTWTSVL